MNFNDLTPEQKAELKKQLAAEEKATKEKERQERDTLKELKHEFVLNFFPKLVEISQNLTLSKAEIFEASKNVLDLKKSIYYTGDESFESQQSHTLSTNDNDKSIIIGCNIVDAWDDDLVKVGQTGVNDWLLKRMNNDNKELVEIIRDLLKPNKDGVLKAKRVLELYKNAVKIGDEELINHVQNIQAAYRPKKTTTYVKAKYRDENGQDIWLNLSMSNA